MPTSLLPSRARRRLTVAAGASATLTLAVTLAACSTPSTTATTAATTATTSSPTVTATPAASADIVALAEAFAATLTDDQKASLYQDYSFANASDWSNLPNALLTGGGAPGGGAPGGGSSGTAAAATGRVGLQTDSLSDAQWTALLALLQAATGTSANEGYDEILQHLASDDYLADQGGGSDYGRGNYFIAFLGTPSTTGTWELQFGGHHLAVANTYTAGALAGATPSFRGIEPFTTVDYEGLTLQSEQQEASAFAALLASLSSDQLATAESSQSYNELLLGPGQDWAFPTTSEGIKGSDLTADQKALLLAAIDTYVDDVDDADAAAILATYESQLDDTYVLWSGTTAMSEVGDYIRIDGPQVWIEFSQQNGIVLSGAHPHAVWRDKLTDYGGLTS